MARVENSNMATGTNVRTAERRPLDAGIVYGRVVDVDSHSNPEHNSTVHAQAVSMADHPPYALSSLSSSAATATAASLAASDSFVFNGGSSAISWPNEVGGVVANEEDEDVVTLR